MIRKTEVRKDEHGRVIGTVDETIDTTPLAGPTGPTGAAGAAGHTGAGTPGAAGATGADGADGATGAAGATGADGADGATGATGSFVWSSVPGSTGDIGVAGDMAYSADMLFICVATNQWKGITLNDF